MSLSLSIIWLYAQLRPSALSQDLLLFLQSNNNDATTGVLCCAGILIFVVALAIASNSEAKKQAEALAQARDAYHNSLIKLKANPTSADLRQTALSRGRTYSNLTRSKKGVTVFDEVALMNDINAACAGAMVIPEKKSITLKQPIEERLEKLIELKAKGLIDEQEFSARKQKILDEV